MRANPPSIFAAVLSSTFFTRVAANLHYGATLLLALGLFPALKFAGLPTRIDWPHFVFGYWIGFGIQSVFWACLFCLIGFPRTTTVLPIWQRYREQPARFLILMPLLAYLYWLSGPRLFVIVAVVAVAMLEFFDRARGRPGHLFKSLSAVLMPAGYMFVGLALVFVYNQIVVVLRFHQAHDVLLDQVDSFVLFGQTVSGVAHSAIRIWPNWLFELFDQAYVLMMPQVGTGLVITALSHGRKRAFQYVSAVITAYYLALLLFWVWPSFSPFYKCANHFSVFPQNLETYAGQTNLFNYLQVLANHGRIDVIRTGYYIAFPCMHIAQPVILLCFLREWKRLFVGLLAYDLFLMISIVLLEFHYVTDLAGGVAVALVTVFVVEKAGRARALSGEGMGRT